MSEHDNNEFLSLETELSRLHEHLLPLKTEIERYKSSAEQLEAGRKSIESASKDVLSQGRLMSEAAGEAASALSKASESLAPLGTSEIKSALQLMQDHLDKTVENMSASLNDVADAAKEISQSNAAISSLPETLASELQKALEVHATLVKTEMTEIKKNQSDQTQAMATKAQTQSDFRTLSERLEILGNRLTEMATEKKQQDKLIHMLGTSLSKELYGIEEKLIIAIENSAPIGMFRKKKTNG